MACLLKTQANYFNLAMATIAFILSPWMEENNVFLVFMSTYQLQRQPVVIVVLVVLCCHVEILTKTWQIVQRCHHHHHHCMSLHPSTFIFHPNPSASAFSWRHKMWTMMKLIRYSVSYMKVIVYYRIKVLIWQLEN